MAIEEPAFEVLEREYAFEVRQKVDELVAWLKSKNLEYIAAPQLARYNPPWTLPFLRRNEILVELIAR